MNSEARSEAWFSGSWPLRIFLAAIAVMIGAWLLQEFLREVPFMAARVKAPNPHEFVVWFNDQQQHCSAEDAAEFSKAVGIIYTDIGARKPSVHKVPGSGRADLCKELDGQIVADVIMRSYKLANEQLIRYIGRQQNDVMRIIDTMGVTDLVKEKQQAVEDAQAQMMKKRERIAAIQNLSK